MIKVQSFYIVQTAQTAQTVWIVTKKLSFIQLRLVLSWVQYENIDDLVDHLWTIGSSCQRIITDCFIFVLNNKVFRQLDIPVLGSIVVSIPACHAGDRGSIPRRGGMKIFCFILRYLRWVGRFLKVKKKRLIFNLIEIQSTKNN